MRKISISVLLLLSLGVFLPSCDKGNGFDESVTEQTDKENVGVHKIVVKTSGNSEATYVGTFAGYKDNKASHTKLYNEIDEEVEIVHVKNGNIGEEFICYTEDEAEELNLFFTAIYVGLEPTEVSYDISTYVNDKKLKTVSKTISFKGLVSGETSKDIEITTTIK